MTLYVATDDPTNSEGIAACARAAGMQVRAMVASPEDVSRVLRLHHGVEPTIAPAPVIESLPPDSFVEVEEEPEPAPAPEPSSGSSEAAVAPVLVVVGAHPEFVYQCREACSEAAVTVTTVPLAEVERVLRHGRPLALVVMEEVYAFDRSKFTRLALEAAIPLVIWSEDIEPDFLAPVLATAARGRAR